MTGMLRTQTRTRIQMRGRNFRKVPEMLSTMAFCRLSMADSLIVADNTATTTIIHTCMQRHQGIKSASEPISRSKKSLQDALWKIMQCSVLHAHRQRRQTADGTAVSNMISRLKEPESFTYPDCRGGDNKCLRLFNIVTIFLV